MQITNDDNNGSVDRGLFFAASSQFLGERRGVYGATLDFGLEIEFGAPEGATTNSSDSITVELRGKFSNF